MGGREFDVLVIGAGIAGVSVAAHLAESRTVAVLEAESHPAYHSTGRSAALFSELYGGPLVRALSRGSRDFFYSPPDGFAEAPLVKPRSVLFVARPDQAAALEAFAALPDVAAGGRRVGAGELLAFCPILRPDNIAEGFLEPDAADIDVHGLHQGYLRLLKKRGGALFTDTPAETLAHTAGRWVIRSRGEEFTAPVVVNAAGAWADVVAGRAGVRPVGLQPKRRTALLVEPPTGMAIDTWPLVIDIDEKFYFKPDAGLLLISPADETPVEPCDAQAEEWDVALAIDRVQAAATLDVRNVKHRWAGLRSFVADRAPVAGYDPDVPGFFWLVGQGGYGIQTAPALSRAAAALLLDEPVPADLSALGLNGQDLSPARLRRT
jgi:D-arginine dehydrogenase